MATASLTRFGGENANLLRLRKFYAINKEYPMEDDTLDDEVVTIEIFLQDLADEVRRVDDAVFTSIGRPPATIFVSQDLVADGVPGTQIGSIASFFTMTPRVTPRNSKVAMLPLTHECYVLWQAGIEKKIRSPSYDLDFSGTGDRGIRDLWLLSAIALVRCRVFFRPDWYKHARLRTVKSMVKHSKIFGDDVFEKLRNLSRRSTDKNRPPQEVDIALTALLVRTALENNYSLTDALTFVATD